MQVRYIVYLIYKQSLLWVSALKRSHLSQWGYIHLISHCACESQQYRHCRLSCCRLYGYLWLQISLRYTYRDVTSVTSPSMYIIIIMTSLRGPWCSEDLQLSGVHRSLYRLDGRHPEEPLLSNGRCLCGMPPACIEMGAF